MLCRRCGYVLNGLSRHQCPECGRCFDPRRPKSYRIAREYRVRRIPAWLNLLLSAWQKCSVAIGILVVVAGIGLVINVVVTRTRELNRTRAKQAISDIVSMGAYEHANGLIDTNIWNGLVSFNRNLFPPRPGVLNDYEMERLNELIDKTTKPVTLDLRFNPVKPEGIAEMQGSRLTEAIVSNRFTTNHVAALTGLPNLELLDLTGSKITDDAVSHLKKIRNLRCLVAYDTELSSKGAKILKSNIPGLIVYRGEWKDDVIKPGWALKDHHVSEHVHVICHNADGSVRWKRTCHRVGRGTCGNNYRTTRLMKNSKHFAVYTRSAIGGFIELFDTDSGNRIKRWAY